MGNLEPLPANHHTPASSAGRDQIKGRPNNKFLLKQIVLDLTGRGSGFEPAVGLSTSYPLPHKKNRLQSVARKWRENKVSHHTGQQRTKVSLTTKNDSVGYALVHLNNHFGLFIPALSIMSRKISDNKLAGRMSRAIIPFPGWVRDGLQVWRTGKKILKSQSQTDDKKWSLRLATERGDISP